MEWARACLELMFRFHGMPFVDLAHLRKSDLKDGYLTLRRRKTGMPLSARVDVELCSCWSATGTGTTLRLIYFVFWMEVWKEWLLTGITCGFYACLTVNCVRLLCGEVPGKVTSYTARHTGPLYEASCCNFPTEIISEGLGHASVTTTEGYMKGFGNSRMDRANKVIMNYIFES